MFCVILCTPFTHWWLNLSNACQNAHNITFTSINFFANYVWPVSTTTYPCASCSDIRFPSVKHPPTLERKWPFYFEHTRQHPANLSQTYTTVTTIMGQVIREKTMPVIQCWNNAMSVCRERCATQLLAGRQRWACPSKTCDARQHL